jgi:hypothetical protein
MSEEITVPVGSPLPGVNISIKVKIKSNSDTQSAGKSTITDEPIDVHDKKPITKEPISIIITPVIETKG